LKKSIIFILVVVLSTFFLVQTGLAAGAEYKIRFTTGFPDYHYMAKQFTELGNLIEEKTDGRVKVEIYYGGQLYKDNQAIEAVQTEMIEAGAVHTFLLSTIVPEFEIFNLPLLFNTTSEVFKVYSHFKDIFVKKLEEKNLVILAGICDSSEQFCLISKKVIKRPEDLRGLKIRATSNVCAEWFKTFGAEPGYISGAELYMALQRGTMNAAGSQLAGLIQRKQYEVANNATMLPWIANMAIAVINRKYLAKLPEDIQQGILEAGSEVSANSVEYVVSEANKLKEKAIELNINVYNPTEEDLIIWRSGMKEMWRKSYAKKPIVLVMANEVIDLLDKAEHFK